MEKLTSRITGISTAAGFYLLSASHALAATEIDPCVGKGSKVGDFSPICNLKAEKFGELLGTVLQLIFIVATVAALFYLIYGGIKWLISEGDKSAVDAARQHIIAAIIGLIVVFLSYFILNIVLNFFIGQSISGIQLPNLDGIGS